LFVYPIHLVQRLPAIKVPLLPGDGEVRLDLQGAFDRAYDEGPFKNRIPYGRPVPPPALSPERESWVETVLQAAGLRPKPKRSGRKRPDR
ncbi:MAG: DUF4058 family protein, partial [Gemmataceae bacterium]|nr:DUF4058 family protein [Gemmataceae bacterium]